MKQVLHARALRTERKKELQGRMKAAGLNWFVIKKLKHLPKGQKNYHQMEGGKVAFINGPELLHALTEIYVEEVYLQKLPAKPVIVDCGANIGISVLYLKRLFPDAQITAFEPDATNCALLRENVANFNLKDVTIRQEAIWNKNEMLYFENKGSQASKISESAASNTSEIRAVRLKEVLQQPVDFLKVDIEGVEYKVIMDVAETIRNVSNLFIEYHGNFNQAHELAEMLGLLSDNGFGFYIKEAANVYEHPLQIEKRSDFYDVQLNIFCIRNEQ
ncbi:FkbM family methyltransferase [Taibaiella soli]|nr:FkbM family methyltransferase [Taibaiella soli]